MDESNTTATVSEVTDDWDMDFSDLEDVNADSGDTEDSGETTEQTEATEETADGDVEQSEADQQTSDEAADGDTTEAKADTDSEKSDQTFKLRYMDEEKEVSKEEAITLAQKGMDYDRIRQKRDEATTELETLKDKLAPIEELANSQNMTLDQLVENTAATLLAQKENLDMDVALGRVRNDMAAKKLEKERAALTAQKSEQDDVAAKREADIKQFKEQYPDVFAKMATDKEAIPQNVWEDVNKGMTLTAAYGKHERAMLKAELEKAKAEAEQAKQKAINKTRSTGSQTTKGATTAQDEFDALWNDGT